MDMSAQEKHNDHKQERRYAAAQLLVTCMKKHIHLSVNENGSLHAEAAPGVIDEKMKATLREYKPQLLALLKEAQRQQQKDSLTIVPQDTQTGIQDDESSSPAQEQAAVYIDGIRITSMGKEAWMKMIQQEAAQAWKEKIEQEQRAAREQVRTRRHQKKEGKHEDNHAGSEEEAE